MLAIPLLQFTFYAMLFAWTRSPGGGYVPYKDWLSGDDDYLRTYHLIAAKRAFLYQVNFSTLTRVIKERNVQTDLFISPTRTGLRRMTTTYGPTTSLPPSAPFSTR